ncbi:hypothetical protein K2173_020592 [Erythroxylum novogranatense]|uniref:Aminotransferase class IV n=1 Tax=Erythroxylum novogranatense TaxID=1862640 RepID=A0AAV8TGS2_9ROSI|nr:hypothetical protein K2173_020592 [Erythroxylum novogranatense]
MAGSRFLFCNGVLSHSTDTPSVTTFLESRPGAYTTTRTHDNNNRLLFWERHLLRLANSARILFDSNPKLLFRSGNSFAPRMITPPMWDSGIRALVNDSVSKVLPVALKERSQGEELAVTTLMTGDMERLSEVSVFEAFDVQVHVGTYVPPVFGVVGNGARLAVVGRGREVAEAKYSDWVRLRKPLEKWRPPSVTELLLSNDGDRLLEGTVTNLFVVSRKDNNGDKYSDCSKSVSPFEVLTAPVSDGVLPGIMRQLVIEVCLNNGIPFQEVAPSWSKRELWQEAFVTSSLRLVQPVEKIQVPSRWESLVLKSSDEILWEEKQFQEEPGMITSIIQKGILEKANKEAYQL